MKVIYAQSILAKIDDVIITAKEHNRVIHEIHLNEDEWEIFTQEVRKNMHVALQARCPKDLNNEAKYNGVKIIKKINEVVDEDDNEDSSDFEQAMFNLMRLIVKDKD